METKDIPGVELARIGTFNASTGKVTFTRKDFDDAAAAYAALKGKVDMPVKLGHTDDQKLLQEDGLPAAGWLDNVRRVGNRLLADLKQVPVKVAELMASGAYRKRSIEAMRNAEFAGQRWPFVITGLALLGADLPAVDSLEDIESLYEAAALELPQDAQLIIIAAERGEENKTMDLTKLRELLGLEESADEAAIEAAMKDALAKGQKTDDLEKALAELKAQVEAGQKGGANDGQDDHEMAELKKNYADALKRIVQLEESASQEKATSQVDAAIKAGKFLPASRENLIRLATKVPEEFRAMVDTTPDNTVFASGAKGGAGNGESNFDLSEYEPTQVELDIAKQLGNSRDDVILAKLEEAELAGVAVPQAVKAKFQPKKD